MKKTGHFQITMLSAAALLFLLALPTSAGKNMEYSIKMRSGDELKCENVKPEADGNLSFVRQGEKLLLSAHLFEYVSTSSRPEKITAALTLLESKKPAYQEAAATFTELAQTYAYCGWDAFCQWKAAEALTADREPTKAIALLTGWEDKELSGPPYRITALEHGRLLLAQLYAQNNERNKAVKIINQLLLSENDAIAVSGFNLLADMLWEDDHRQDAVLCYLRPVILFDRSVSGREYALRRLSESLEKMNDDRSKIYREQLKQEYSDTKK